MVEGEAITLFGDGTQARDYTYCDDIVAGVTAAIDWTATAPIGLEPFNLGGNRSVPTGDMVAEIAQALGIEPKLQWGPMQPGDVQRTAADLTRSGAVLGYAPDDAVSGGDPPLRRLVPGGLWPVRLSACWPGRAIASRCRTTTARSTCSRRSSPRAAPSRTCTTSSASRSRCWAAPKRR